MAYPLPSCLFRVRSRSSRARVGWAMSVSRCSSRRCRIGVELIAALKSLKRSQEASKANDVSRHSEDGQRQGKEEQTNMNRDYKEVLCPRRDFMIEENEPQTTCEQTRICRIICIPQHTP